jgi:hypothetical protein
MYDLLVAAKRLRRVPTGRLEVDHEQRITSMSTIGNTVGQLQPTGERLNRFTFSKPAEFLSGRFQPKEIGGRRILFAARLIPEF